MTNLFIMAAAAADDSGLILLPGSWEDQGMGVRELWSENKNAVLRVPWQELEKQLSDRAPRMTVLQVEEPTHFVCPDSNDFDCPFFVDRRVVLSLERANLKNWQALPYKFKVVDLSRDFLRTEIYFRIVALGPLPECAKENWERIDQYDKVAREMKTIGYEKSQEQGELKRFNEVKRRWIETRFVPRMESWEGSDFMFGPGAAYLKGSIACSRKVLELAHKEQWTNAAFQPFDMITQNFQDFRLRCWPPEKWYPKWHPAFDPLLHNGEDEEALQNARRQAKPKRPLPPTWDSLGILGSRNSEAGLQFAKANSAILAKAPVSDVVKGMMLFGKFEVLLDFLELFPEGPAQEGILIYALEVCFLATDGPGWFRGLSPGTQAKMRELLENPPWDVIEDLGSWMKLGDSNSRKLIAEVFGIEFVPHDEDED